MQNALWKKAARLAVFTALALILVLDLGFAWTYSRALTRPACGQPTPLAEDLPAPQTIQLTAADGASVPAWYFPSRNRAAVIALGGTQGALGNTLPPIEFLLREGYGVLQVGSRACADPPAPVTLGYKEALDTQAALQFLLQEQDIDAARIGAFGFSMGGVAAIRAAARNTQITAVVAEGGYHNLAEDILEPRTSSWFEQIFLYPVLGMFWLQTGVNPWQSRPIDDLPFIAPRPVLLIYGEHEAANGRAEAQYQAALEPKELWIVPGGAHGINYRIAPEEYAARVLAFFDRWLLDNP